MVRRRHLLGVVAGLLYGVEPAPGAGRAIVDGSHPYLSTGWRRCGREAQLVERDLSVGRPLQHELDVDRGGPRRRLQGAIEEDAPVLLLLEAPDVVRQLFIAERASPAKKDRDGLPDGRDVDRARPPAEPVVAAPLQPRDVGRPSAVDVRSPSTRRVQHVAVCTVADGYAWSRYGARSKCAPPIGGRRNQSGSRRRSIRGAAREGSSSVRAIPGGRPGVRSPGRWNRRSRAAAGESDERGERERVPHATS